MVQADIAQLQALVRSWRAEAAAIGQLDWSALERVTGDSCAAAAAARACEVPAVRAKGAISTRFGVMAGQVETFTGDVAARDGDTAAALERLDRQ